MHKLTLIAAAAAALALAASAGAASPQHFRFTGHDQFVVTETCSFPIVGDFINTSDVTEFDSPSGTIERLQLHQSSVGTLVGNGVTLKLSEHTQTFVTFVDGAATLAIHVGVLSSTSSRRTAPSSRSPVRRCGRSKTASTTPSSPSTESTSAAMTPRSAPPSSSQKYDERCRRRESRRSRPHT